MPDAVVVEGDQDEPAITPAEVSAHTAAVAEGMTAVQAESAAESAEAAEAAAELALEAARANAETAGAVIEATTVAEGNAEAAKLSAEMVMEALAAQTKSIELLTEELRASRKAAAPADKPARPAPDREPNGGGGRRWSRR